MDDFEQAYDVFGDAASGALKVVLTRDEEVVLTRDEEEEEE